MLDQLTSIWRGVLGRPHIGGDDDFFDLGGDPWSAVRLFSEISRMSGRELSPLIIYQTPTVTSLAAALQEAASPPIPPLIRLKPGSNETPLFLAHGAGGSVMELFEVAKRVRSPHAIYGMQARGADGLEAPFDCVEDMAEFHIAAIKQLQSRGPYILAGYSFGGLIALEIAQRLREQGDQIGLLVMLDSFPALHFLSRKQLARLKIRRKIHHRSAAFKHLANRFRHRFRPAAKRADERPPIFGAFTAAMRQVGDCALRALESYQPRFYEGQIRFVRPKDAWVFSVDPAGVWARMAHDLRIESVPGDHHEMLTKHAKTLAAVISRYLEEVRP